VNKYEFVSVGRVLFGPGEARRVREIVAGLGRRALVVYNGTGVEKVIDGVMVRQKGEPTVGDVDAAVAVAIRERCDVVVGFGGGSAIDTAKAVAGLVTNGGSVVDYMEVVGKGQKIVRPALPWVAVPTTAGTGAEVTRNAVVGWPERKFKASVRSDLLLARMAVVDPELGVGVPADVTAASGMDALCQCVESYVSKNANPMTDGLAIEGIRLAAKYLKRAWEHGEDLEARAGMAQAALISGITLTNAGLGAVHGFAAPVGANYPVPHGVVCAALLPGVMEANVRAAWGGGNEAVVRKYGEVARAMTGDRGATAEDGVKFVAALVKEMGIPKLERYGMSQESVRPMMELARRASSMRYNPVELPDEVLGQVLLGSIQG
jgi:alcohol dehydrogenase class IV